MYYVKQNSFVLFSYISFYQTGIKVNLGELIWSVRFRCLAVFYLMDRNNLQNLSGKIRIVFWVQLCSWLQMEEKQTKHGEHTHTV